MSLACMQNTLSETPVGGSRSSNFCSLDDDILADIFELLRHGHQLQPLSRTCRWIREACKPVLFRRTCVRSSRLSCIREYFIPEAVWPHIRTLCFIQEFETTPLPPYHYPGNLRDVAHTLSCALMQMNKLRAVELRGVGLNGVPWMILGAILSVPHLRSFKLLQSLNRNELVDPGFRFTCAPLRHFAYVNFNKYRITPRQSAMEICLLASVIEQASNTLETLTVSSEPAPPLVTIASYPWPRLRHLTLQGDRTRILADSPEPLVSYLAHMPSLRTLVLDMALSTDAPEPMWPAALPGEFPWPELQLLSIAYPHPEDQIYRHLPPSLATLSLRCWPRHYIFKNFPHIQSSKHFRWRSPVLSSTELLRIAHRCQSPSIKTLDVEYREDASDAELLSFLPVAFPNLTMLTLHRYRIRREADDVDVSELARALAPLVHLRILRVYLDPVEEPHPLTIVGDYGRAQLQRLVRGFQLQVDTLARTLAGSLELICFLRRRFNSNEWLCYQVVVDADGGRRGQYDPCVADEYGIDAYEDDGPSMAQWESMMYSRHP